MSPAAEIDGGGGGVKGVHIFRAGQAGSEFVSSLIVLLLGKKDV